MLNFERTHTSSQHVDPSGDEYTMVSERLAIGFGGRHAWLGAAYTHPLAIVRQGSSRRIVDPVMVTRLVALLAVTLAMMIGALRR